MHILHRTSQAACCPSRGSDHESRRAEGDLRWRSCRGREETSTTLVGRCVTTGTTSTSMSSPSCGVAASDRRFDEGARDVESCEEAGDLVFRWTSICEGDPANSRQCARVGRLDKRAELRFEERSRIWGHQHSCSDWFTVEPRHLPARVGLKRCSRVPFFDDGVSHRRVRCEKKVDPSGSRDASRDAVDTREPRVKAGYGLRGVRVGEASNPGPSQARAMFHDTEAAADGAIASLERELTSLDTSDDEPMVRPAGSRMVPRVANARFPGHSRHLRRLPVSRSHFIYSASCIRRIAVDGERSSGGCSSSDGYERQRF